MSMKGVQISEYIGQHKGSYMVVNKGQHINS